MRCPFCGHEETKVIDSRLAAEGRQIRRRRECLQCGERFTTFETAELVMPHVVKSDGSREPFDEAKLAARHAEGAGEAPGQQRGRGVQAVERVCHRLRMLGEREMPSRTVGETVMEELRHLDEVAYVRFASVYRSFQDVEAFRDAIEHLRHQRRRHDADRSQLPLLPGETPPGKKGR
jgi:transcriptional repressor NrdR